MSAEELLEEHNLARTAPNAYAAHLADRLDPQSWSGNNFKRHDSVVLCTQEGRAAVEVKRT